MQEQLTSLNAYSKMCSESLLIPDHHDTNHNQSVLFFLFLLPRYAGEISLLINSKQSKKKNRPRPEGRFFFANESCLSIITYYKHYDNQTKQPGAHHHRRSLLS